MDSETLILIVGTIILVVIALVVMASGLTVVQPHERGMYFRLGRFIRVLSPGLNQVAPLISEVKKIDLRESVLALSFDDLLTRDRSQLEMKAKVHFKVTDPMKAFFETPDYKAVVRESALTAIRVAIRNRDKDAIWADSGRIGQAVKEELGGAVSRFGISIEAIELGP